MVSLWLTFSGKLQKSQMLRLSLSIRLRGAHLILIHSRFIYVCSIIITSYSSNVFSFCRVGIVFCGRQSPGGHNVIWGLHSALKIHNPNSTLLGFLGKLHFLLSFFIFFGLCKLVCVFVIASEMCFYPPMNTCTWIYIIRSDVIFFFWKFILYEVFKVFGCTNSSY